MNFQFTVKNPYIKKILVDKYRMKVFTMSGRTKGSIVERWNRTFKTRLERYFTEHNTKKWTDVLQDFTRNINDSVNRSIGIAPSKVTSSNAYLIRQRLYDEPDAVQPCSLNVGDRVRIPKVKNIHSKGYSQNWSDTVYTIVKSQTSLDICYYTIENPDGDVLDRTFYADELNFVSRPNNK